MSARRWTLEGLACVTMLATAGVPNAHIAVETDRLASDVDLALWALVGRTPEEALQRLNGPEDAATRPRSLKVETREVLAGLRSLASHDDEIFCEPVQSLRVFLARTADLLEAVTAPQALQLNPEIRA